MSMIDFALGLAGMSGDQIADLDKAMPALARLAEAMKAAEPILTKAKPHIDALEPLIGQVYPIFAKAWPDIVSVTPTINELIDFIKSKEQP